jgi:hypothetical protein
MRHIFFLKEKWPSGVETMAIVQGDDAADVADEIMWRNAALLGATIRIYHVAEQPATIDLDELKPDITISHDDDGDMTVEMDAYMDIEIVSQVTACLSRMAEDVNNAEEEVVSE